MVGWREALNGAAPKGRGGGAAARRLRDAIGEPGAKRRHLVADGSEIEKTATTWGRDRVARGKRGARKPPGRKCRIYDPAVEAVLYALERLKRTYLEDHIHVAMRDALEDAVSAARFAAALARGARAGRRSSLQRPRSARPWPAS